MAVVNILNKQFYDEQILKEIVKKKNINKNFFSFYNLSNISKEDINFIISDISKIVKESISKSNNQDFKYSFELITKYLPKLFKKEIQELENKNKNSENLILEFFLSKIIVQFFQKEKIFIKWTILYLLGKNNDENSLKKIYFILLKAILDYINNFLIWYIFISEIDSAKFTKEVISIIFFSIIFAFWIVYLFYNYLWQFLS